MANKPLEPPRRNPSNSGSQAKMPVQQRVNHQKTFFGFTKSDVFVNGGFDVPFFIAVIALLTIGLVMLFSASYPYALQNEGDSYAFIKKQLIFAIVGFGAMMLMSKVNYRWLKVAMPPLVVLTIMLLGLVLVWHTDVRGFKRWIPLGPFQFQPSDVAKFTIIILMSWYVTKFGSKMKQNKYGLIYPACIIAVFCGLIFLEHHLSCTILVFLIGVSIMLVGGTNIKWFFAGLGLVAAVVVFVIMSPEVLMNYAGDRIVAWLDKSFEPLGLRWQTNNSLYAIGSGGFFGVGIGNSKQKYLYVSEPQNDFIFSIVVEELGFIGAICILALFGFLFVRGIKIAKNCPDPFGSYVVIGIVTQVAVQALFNVMVVTDTIPNTGISLPFFSSGGTALLMLLFEMGVVLAISRKTNQKRV